jgi:hypothetical protein
MEVGIIMRSMVIGISVHWADISSSFDTQV